MFLCKCPLVLGVCGVREKFLRTIYTWKPMYNDNVSVLCDKASKHSLRFQHHRTGCPVASADRQFKSRS